MCFFDSFMIPKPVSPVSSTAPNIMKLTCSGLVCGLPPGRPGGRGVGVGVGVGVGAGVHMAVSTLLPGIVKVFPTWTVPFGNLQPPNTKPGCTGTAGTFTTLPSGPARSPVSKP